MSTRELISVIAFSLAGGMIGGITANTLFTDMSAFAERANKIEKAVWVDTVIARNFQLLDEEDNIRGVFSLTSGGRLYFDFRDSKSVLRAELFLDPGGAAGLSLFDGQGEERSRLSVEATGMPMLIFYDAQGTLRAAVGLNSNEIPSISFQDQRGNKRVMAGFISAEMPSIRIYDRDCNKRAVLGGAKLQNMNTGEKVQRPSSSLVLADENGHVVMGAP